jgi:hypothetical protein
VQIKGQLLFKGVIAKMGWDRLKIFFSITTKPEKLIMKAS